MIGAVTYIVVAAMKLRMKMIKATTSHGTYYLIDEENMKAIRVPPSNKEDVYANTEGWFNFFHWTGAKVGEGMMFYLAPTPENPFDYQKSTVVVSVEDVDAPISGHFPSCTWDGLVVNRYSCKCYY